MAGIYGYLSEYEKCAKLYEELINDYPNNEEFYFNAIDVLSMFDLERALNIMGKKEEVKVEEPKDEKIALLEEIRDLLKENKKLN